MNDKEIYSYLKKNNYRIKATEGINVLNSSPQIIDEYYDYDNKTMTIITPDNTFTFEWLLGNGE